MLKTLRTFQVLLACLGFCFILLQGSSQIPEHDEPAHNKKNRLCKREEVRQGAWQPTRRDTPPYPSTHVRTCAFAESGGPYVDYEWIPEAVENQILSLCEMERIVWSRVARCFLWGALYPMSNTMA